MDNSQATLYHHAYSVCSIMVRYTLALKGSPKDDASTLNVREVQVNIFQGENLTEGFLCDINRYGQVPVLDVREESPIEDSLQITFFISKRYPNLIPKSHEEEITSLLKELHEVNYFSLSFAEYGGAHVATGLAATVETLLQDPNISNRYRRALEFKIGVVKGSKVAGMEPETIKEMEYRAKVILGRLADTIPENSHDSGNGPWLFGLQEPSALDAHAVVFIERMRDVGRIGLVPDILNSYSQRATEQDVWRSMMNGRRTMVPRPKA